VTIRQTLAATSANDITIWDPRYEGSGDGKLVKPLSGLRNEDVLIGQFRKLQNRKSRGRVVDERLIGKVPAHGSSKGGADNRTLSPNSHRENVSPIY